MEGLILTRQGGSYMKSKIIRMNHKRKEDFFDVWLLKGSLTQWSGWVDNCCTQCIILKIELSLCCLRLLELRYLCIPITIYLMTELVRMSLGHGNDMSRYTLSFVCVCIDPLFNPCYNRFRWIFTGLNLWRAASESRVTPLAILLERIRPHKSNNVWYQHQVSTIVGSWDTGGQVEKMRDAWRGYDCVVWLKHTRRVGNVEHLVDGACVHWLPLRLTVGLRWCIWWQALVVDEMNGKESSLLHWPYIMWSYPS